MCGSATGNTSPSGTSCGMLVKRTGVVWQRAHRGTPMRRLLKNWLWGVYPLEWGGGEMHGRVFYSKELRYGFEKDRFVLRVDCFSDVLRELDDPEFRIVFGGKEETTVVVNLERGRMKEFALEKGRVC